MTDYNVDDLPAYLQNSQLVKDCRETDTKIIFCPYEIPSTNEMKTLDDFKKMYFVANYFSLDYLSEFIEFVDRTRQRILLLDFLNNVDMITVNFDELYGHLMFGLFTQIIPYDEIGFCDLCRKWIKNLKRFTLPCGCDVCDNCCKKTNIKIAAKCPICDNPIFIKHHKFAVIATDCETHV
jgi:hypothetical protein